MPQPVNALVLEDIRRVGIDDLTFAQTREVVRLEIGIGLEVRLHHAVVAPAREASVAQAKGPGRIFSVVRVRVFAQLVNVVVRSPLQVLVLRGQLRQAVLCGPGPVCRQDSFKFGQHRIVDGYAGMPRLVVVAAGETPGGDGYPARKEGKHTEDTNG